MGRWSHQDSYVWESLLSSLRESLAGACCCLSVVGTTGEHRWQSTRWCLQKTQGLDWVGSGWKLKSCCLREGSLDQTLIAPQWSLEFWAPTSAQPVLPDSIVLLPQHRILRRKSPTRRGKEGLSSGKAVSPKSCQKLLTSNGEECGRRRNHIPATALL